MESNKYIRAFWYISNNFGDNLNHYLIKKLSGKDVVYAHDRDNLKHYICIGSILSESNKHTTVWGAGFGSNTSELNKESKVISVRGEISANKISQSVSIIGDPALLMPLIYKPKTGKKHRIGIIPHFLNYGHVLNVLSEEYHIIDPFLPVEDFVNEVNMCECVFSSGLHGLIIADAYKIPNCWVDFGCEIGGDGIKFSDYYTSTKTGYKFNKIRYDNSTIFDISMCQVNEYKLELSHLLNSCPFINKEIWK